MRTVAVLFANMWRGLCDRAIEVKNPICECWVWICTIKQKTTTTTTKKIVEKSTTTTLDAFGLNGNKFHAINGKKSVRKTVETKIEKNKKKQKLKIHLQLHIYTALVCTWGIKNNFALCKSCVCLEKIVVASSHHNRTTTTTTTTTTAAANERGENDEAEFLFNSNFNKSLRLVDWKCECNCELGKGKEEKYCVRRYCAGSMQTCQMYVRRQSTPNQMQIQN